MSRSGLQQRDIKIIEGLEGRTCEERVRDLRLFTSEKAQGNLINVYEHLMGKGEIEKTEPNASQWCPCAGQELMGIN